MEGLGAAFGCRLELAGLSDATAHCPTWCKDKWDWREGAMACKE